VPTCDMFLSFVFFCSAVRRNKVNKERISNDRLTCLQELHDLAINNCYQPLSSIRVCLMLLVLVRFTGVARILCWGGLRTDEGVERGRGMGRGYLLPQPTRGSGERRKLPQRGPGQSPGRKRILVHFELEKTNVVMTNLIFFVIFIAHI